MKRQKPRPADAPAAGQAAAANEAATRSARICLGIVTGPQGVQGAVRIKSFAGVPEDIGRYGPLEDESGGARYTVSVVGTAKGVVVARLSGVADRNRAEALRGCRLYLARAALPPAGDDEYYHADLIGLVAVRADGTALGRVQAVHDFGAGDVIELARAGAPAVLVPFTRAVVPVVDLAAGHLVLDPPPGLFEAAPGDEDEDAEEGNEEAVDEPRPRS